MSHCDENHEPQGWDSTSSTKVENLVNLTFEKKYKLKKTARMDLGRFQNIQNDFIKETIKKRLDSNIDSVTLNKTYFYIVEIFNKLF